MGASSEQGQNLGSALELFAVRMAALTGAVIKLEKVMTRAFEGAAARGFQFAPSGAGGGEKIVGFDAGAAGEQFASSAAAGIVRGAADLPVVGGLVDRRFGVSAADSAAQRTAALTVPLARAGAPISDQDRQQLFDLFDVQERRAFAEQQQLQALADRQVAGRAGQAAADAPASRLAAGLVGDRLGPLVTSANPFFAPINALIELFMPDTQR